ncbi:MULTISPECIES: alpha/beta hydrolase [Streptosporangium]|uniref:Peptidase S33 tripeptidyl aminopeptidase-like C-terminal domain-containing protein n=1 Tax=Streptosporangium brasiliense TaxID=47480 RepID=A0ABT9RIZ1_9ACTN|nr:alpha/beta hydrolase [Streptosporangium brasiliense]MDP9868776.1 hypothetical protein [Streptosporangium brasiliense]
MFRSVGWMLSVPARARTASGFPLAEPCSSRRSVHRALIGTAGTLDHLDVAVLHQGFPDSATAPSARVVAWLVDTGAVGAEALHPSDANPQGRCMTRDAVLATVDKINRRSVKIGGYRVDAQIVPYWLFLRLYSDSPQSYATLAEEARALSRAGATPPPASLKQFLDGVFTGAGDASDRAGTAILCGDRAAPRDPLVYYRDIQRHRTAEPLFGPLARNIPPCAFWLVKPLEPATTIGNAVPALIVGAAGDPATPYPGQQAMHRALTGSRMITLKGAYRHTVYLVAGSTCVDTNVSRYLIDGVLPSKDVTCTRSNA